MESGIKSHGKNLISGKNIHKKFYCSDYFDVSFNKYGVKCRTSLRSWENEGWINEINPYGWFQWYFRHWLEDHKMIKDKLIDGKITVSRFRDKLVKMIKDNGSKFDDYSISSKNRQVLLHLDYELTEKDFFTNSTN